jgi:hypothetical protein
VIREPRVLGRDTSELRHPLLCVALPEGVFVNPIARMHGYQPGKAHMKGFLGTHQQVGLCLVEDLLYFVER